MNFQDAGEQGTAVQVGEDGTEHHLADGLARGIALRLAEEIGHEFLVLEEILLEPLALDVGVEVGLHRCQDRREEFLVDKLGQGLGALLPEPEQEVAGCGALADELLTWSAKDSLRPVRRTGGRVSPLSRGSAVRRSFRARSSQSEGKAPGKASSTLAYLAAGISSKISPSFEGDSARKEVMVAASGPGFEASWREQISSRMTRSSTALAR